MLAAFHELRQGLRKMLNSRGWPLLSGKLEMFSVTTRYLVR